HVGNVMLYQAELRSLPIRRGQITGTRRECKPVFSIFYPCGQSNSRDAGGMRRAERVFDKSTNINGAWGLGAADKPNCRAAGP
ncbi:MAG: hypothetical protein WCL11_07895, partial [Verrucomicrobiota bacterium]